MKMKVEFSPWQLCHIFGVFVTFNLHEIWPTEETSPTGNMGKAKKLGRSDMIYGLGPSLEGEEKKPDTEPNTPNIPFTTPVGRLLRGSRQTTVLAERSASLSVSCLAKGYAHGETAS